MARLYLLICLLFCLAPDANASDIFRFPNSPGRYGVGVNMIQKYDWSRVYRLPVDQYTGEPTTGERARPIQALVWYPAEGGGKRQTFRDYIETVASEDDFALSRAELRRMTDALIEEAGGARRAAFLRDLARPMLAVRNARPLAGKFPVVIYAPSFSNSAMENADLCEYLASHGYVVLASPALGAHTRTNALTLEGLDTQAKDISYLIGEARLLPQADMTKVGVVGFSWGGLANVLAAARDPRIKALVSLDGSLPGDFRSLGEADKDFEKHAAPARVAVPMLYLAEPPAAPEKPGQDAGASQYAFMDRMRYSDVYIVSLTPMRDVDFSSYNQRTTVDEAFREHSRDEVAAAYGWAARYTLRFLDAYLKDDPAGLAFVNNTPVANGAPPRMVTTDIRRKQNDLPPTWENFIKRLANDGFDTAIPLYEGFLARGAEFRIEQNDIVGWAAYLKQHKSPAQAREVYRLATHIDPSSLGALFALADMQVKTGQANEAAGTYRKILERDPNNGEASKRLDKLAR